MRNNVDFEREIVPADGTSAAGLVYGTETSVHRHFRQRSDKQLLVYIVHMGVSDASTIGGQEICVH
jgi:hypothetical protein